MQYILGDLNISYVLGAFFWMSVGTILVKYFRFQRREKGKVRKAEVSCLYWLKDNYLGISIHILIALISVRFTSQFVHLAGEKLALVLGNNTDPMYIYLVFGLSLQSLIDALQKLTRK